MIRKLRTLNRDQSGQLMPLALIGMLLGLALIYAVMNTGASIYDRIKAQGAADVAAITQANWGGRTLNTMSMNNVSLAQLESVLWTGAAFNQTQIEMGRVAYNIFMAIQDRCSNPANTIISLVQAIFGVKASLEETASAVSNARVPDTEKAYKNGESEGFNWYSFWCNVAHAPIHAGIAATIAGIAAFYAQYLPLRTITYSSRNIHAINEMNKYLVDAFPATSYYFAQSIAKENGADSLLFYAPNGTEGLGGARLPVGSGGLVRDEGVVADLCSAAEVGALNSSDRSGFVERNFSTGSGPYLRGGRNFNSLKKHNDEDVRVGGEVGDKIAKVLSLLPIAGSWDNNLDGILYGSDTTYEFKLNPFKLVIPFDIPSIFPKEWQEFEIPGITLGFRHPDLGPNYDEHQRKRDNYFTQTDDTNWRQFCVSGALNSVFTGIERDFSKMRDSIRSIPGGSFIEGALDGLSRFDIYPEPFWLDVRSETAAAAARGLGRQSPTLVEEFGVGEGVSLLTGGAVQPITVEEFQRKFSIVAFAVRTRGFRIDTSKLRWYGEEKFNIGNRDLSFRNPADYATATAQAMIYNPRGADLYTQDWRGKLTPIKVIENDADRRNLPSVLKDPRVAGALDVFADWIATEGRVSPVNNR